MTCMICKNGQTKDGTTTVTLERGKTTVVFKSVPARICATCGEVYLEKDVSQRLFAEASEAASSGVEVEVRAYAA